MHTEEDDNEEEKEEEKMDVDEEGKSPEEDETKPEPVKDEGGNKDEPEILPAAKETSEIKALEDEKTDKSDAESSDKDSCKVEGLLSVSSNAIDNKENETKGDDK